MNEQQITNKIFSEDRPQSLAHPHGSIIKKDRLQLLDDTVGKELNTYRNWGYTTLEIEPIIVGMDGDTAMSSTIKIPVTKALFNNINATPLMDQVRMSNNAPLLDSPSTRRELRNKSVCTIKELVRASGAGEMGRAIYNYSDFMYCKHLGKIPNNYLITLRRFPFPCDDHINYVNHQNKDERDILKHAPDMGRLITWIGTPGNEMSNILKYNFGVAWKDLTAEIQEQQDMGDSANGPLAQLMNAMNPQYQKQVAQGVAGDSAVGAMKTLLGSKISDALIGDARVPYGTAQWLQMSGDTNKIYGPLDVITKTTVREDTAKGSGGLQFNQEISLVFDYELRSYDGINAKAAFLDLLANILTVTYTTGTFWGGSIRMYGAHQSNTFANLPLFKSNPPTTTDNFIDRITESFTQAWSGIKNMFSGDNLQKTLSGFGNMAIGLMLNKLGRPHKFAFNSMLSPAPTGPWHITIGNPKNPIMQMGNMILTDTEIEHYGPLGLDDFPTGIRVTCKLKHGKPRDQIGIEKMFLNGDNRIYTPANKDIIKLYTECKDYKQSASASDNNKTYNNSTNESGEVQEQIKNLGFGSSNTNQVNDQNVDVFMKFFGMSDQATIIKSAQEGSFGSEIKKKVNGN